MNELSLKDIEEKYRSMEKELIEDLKNLISIKSVRGEPTVKNGELLPFGEGVHESLMFMKSLAERDGFSFTNVDNYQGHIDFGLNKDNIMGILLHLDVVPEGEGWTREPLKGTLEEGRLYGRGTNDDKGPAISAYYSVKVLKELGFLPEKGIRLVLGLDEETGWSGMDYYLEKVKAPDFGFTPDANFPVIKGEKGILIFDIVRKLSKTVGIEKGLEIKSLKAGSAPNMVADYARALVFHEHKDMYRLIEEQAEAFNIDKEYKVKVKPIGKSLEIVTKGKSSHGAKPEQGYNALSLLMDFLGTLSFKEDSVNDFISFYNNHIGFEVTGKNLGILLEDEQSGALVVNVGKGYIDDKEARVTVNVRYPVTYRDEDIYKKLMEVLHPLDLGIVKTMVQHPIYFDEEDSMVQALMECYREVTGDYKSSPLVIGGGTYARAMKNFVSFGPLFPHEEDVAHKQDEYIDVESLIKAGVIYAKSIYELTK